MSQPNTAKQSERWQAAVRAANKGSVPTSGKLMARFGNSIRKRKAAGPNFSTVKSSWHSVVGAAAEGRA